MHNPWSNTEWMYFSSRSMHRACCIFAGQILHIKVKIAVMKFPLQCTNHSNKYQSNFTLSSINEIKDKNDWSIAIEKKNCWLYQSVHSFTCHLFRLSIRRWFVWPMLKLRWIDMDIPRGPLFSIGLHLFFYWTFGLCKYENDRYKALRIYCLNRYSKWTTILELLTRKYYISFLNNRFLFVKIHH